MTNTNRNNYLLKDLVREADVLYVKELEWQGKNRTFCTEMSRVRGPFRPSTRTITVKNPSTMEARVFNFVKEQKDGSNEDTYYWLFECLIDKLKLYIWND